MMSKNNRLFQSYRKTAKQIATVLVILMFLQAFIPVLVLETKLRTHCKYDCPDTSHLITLETEDGEFISTYVSPCSSPDSALIIASGISGPSHDDFIPLSEILCGENTITLVPDLRCHGTSTGNVIGLGYTEVFDIMAAVNYIESTYGDIPITVLGFSMGGAVALNSLSSVPELDGCIAVSSYSSFIDNMRFHMKHYHVPEFLIDYSMFFMKLLLSAHFGHDTVFSFNPSDSIKNSSGRPVAILASYYDKTVPVDNAYVLSVSDPDAILWIRESSNHFFIDVPSFDRINEDDEFMDFITEFIDKTR